MKSIINLFRKKHWKIVYREELSRYYGESDFDASYGLDIHASAKKPLVIVYAYHYECIVTGATKIVKHEKIN